MRFLPPGADYRDTNQADLCRDAIKKTVVAGIAAAGGLLLYFGITGIHDSQVDDDGSNSQNMAVPVILTTVGALASCVAVTAWCACSTPDYAERRPPALPDGFQTI